MTDVTGNEATPPKSAEGKKPSEIASDPREFQRETGRMTDMNDGDFIPVAKSFKSTTVCCCIDPYINEKSHIYVPGAVIKEGDLYKHRVHYLTMIVCFNICYNIEHTTETLVQRASDGALIRNVRSDDLSNTANYILVKTEKCPYKHHELRRLSVCGRLLMFLCTTKGLLSTCRKCCCLEDCTSSVNIATVRCERTLYSKRDVPQRS